jgi:hypothetical protein
MLQEEAELFQAYGEDFAPEYRREHWAQGPITPGTPPGVPASATPSAPTSMVPAAPSHPSSSAPLPASAVPAGALPGSMPSAMTATPTSYHAPSSPVPLPVSASPTQGARPVAATPGATIPVHPSHPSQGSTELPPIEGVTRNGGREQWRGGAWVPAQPGHWHEGQVRVNPDGTRLVYRRGDWVRGDEVSQIVVFSDGSFRVYYRDGRWRPGRRGEPYPAGPIFRDVATLPVGPRFSFFVSGTDAYRVDNVTNQRFFLGQYMPDHRVLVGSILYHPRPDGTLEWVGPPEVGKNPQADANLVALEAVIKVEATQAKKTAAVAAKLEREEAQKLARARRQGQREEIVVVMGRPAPMAPTTGALPQAVGSVPAYVIAASAQPSGPSLEDIAAVTAEAAYEGAQLAVEESQGFDEPPSDVLVEELDVFGGDPTGGGLGYGYHDPRSE